VREYDGHVVNATTILREPALMCLWLGCPSTAHKRSNAAAASSSWWP
jgi:hypothetical protein